MSSAEQAVSQVQLADVDLTSLRWHSDGPPHELFARMRREAPVRWNPLPDGTGAWSLTRHADIAAVSRDTATFSSHRAGIFLHPDQVTPLELNRNLLLYKDPPEHTKYRLILQSAFTPRTVAVLEDAVRARVTRAIDRVIERGSCDFATDIAVPVPLEVLGELMGVPEQDIPKFARWTDEIEAAQRAPEPNGAVEVFGEMAVYLAAQIERQAREGREDSLVMRLSRAEVDGQRLDDSEILVFFGLLAFAGNDTTRNTAATGMLALLEHPQTLARLRAQPDLIGQAVEEILRYTSVVKYFVRSATRDTAIGPHAIREGDRVILWYSSGSRDETVNPGAERFDVDRQRAEHMAFGGGGRHFCLGAGLARLELRVIFEEVLRRLEGIERSGPVQRLPSAWANGLLSLPVSFAPGPVQA
jgi:cytochrome P450